MEPPQYALFEVFGVPPAVTVVNSFICLIIINLQERIDMANYSLGKDTYIKARIGWQGLTTSEYLDYGDYYLVTGTDIKNGLLDFSSCVFVSKKRFDQDSHIQLKVDDVLISKDGTIGKVAYVNSLPLPATLNSGVFVIRCDNSKLSQKYFYYVIKSKLFKDFIEQTSAGSTIVHLYQKDIVKFNFPIPDTLTEQHHIVNIMESIDNLIDSLEELKTKAELQLQAVMTTHFNSLDVENARLNTLLAIKKGTQFNGDKLSTNGIYKMFNGGASYSGMLNQFNCDKDTIIISEGGNSCGFVNYVKERFWAGGHCYVVTPNKNIDKKYLFYALKQFQKKIMNLRVGSGLPNIQKKTLYQLEIKLSANAKVQANYGAIFQSFSDKVLELENKIEKYKQIREGLLDGLFTGKIDVPADYKEV